MTSQTFKHNVLSVALFMVASVGIHAQQPTMQALIDQSLAKVWSSEKHSAPSDGGASTNPESVTPQQPAPEAFLNCIAELKRIDAMFPDSIQPKHQMALQSLIFSVTYPHAPQTENLLAEAEQAITKMEQMKNADQSDICTLRGFLYMVRIVQNPAQNGQRYYLEVMEDYEKALKLNPDNELARQLQQQFLEGMRQATGR